MKGAGLIARRDVALGAYCEAPGKPYHGQECDYYKSTCGDTTQECHGRYGVILSGSSSIQDFRSADPVSESPILNPTASSQVTSFKALRN